MPQAASGGEGGVSQNAVLGLLAQLDPKSILPYVAQKPENYTLGRTRFDSRNQPIASVSDTQMVNLGDRYEAVDRNAVAPGSQFPMGVSPNTTYTQGQENQRFDRPSGSTVYTQGQLNQRHDRPSATSRQSGPGIHQLPNGSTISNAQMFQQWKAEHNLMESVDLQILSKTDPARAARERDKIDRARPFQQWARERFGVDVTGGFGGGSPALPPLPGQLPPLPGQQPGNSQPRPGNATERRQLNGKTYVKRGGTWYEE